jgi:RHS repeat-associated protein
MGCLKLTYYHQQEALKENSFFSGNTLEKKGIAEKKRIDAYRYGFNGMERDDEMKGIGNSYDFGARMYDPRLGRFLSLDPDFNKYPWNSPYDYAINSPIKFQDKEGKGPDIIINNSSKSQIKLTGSATVVFHVGNSPDLVYRSQEIMGSIVLNPGDKFYEVDEMVKIGNGDDAIFVSGIGKVVRSDGTEEYVLLNDIDFIDVEDGQTFEVNGELITNDVNKEVDRNEEANPTKRQNVPRKEVGVYEDIDGISDTKDKMESGEEWIPKPNIGEIKLTDPCGTVTITDGNKNGTPVLNVSDDSVFGEISTK